MLCYAMRQAHHDEPEASTTMDGAAAAAAMAGTAVGAAAAAAAAAESGTEASLSAELTAMWPSLAALIVSRRTRFEAGSRAVAKAHSIA